MNKIGTIGALLLAATVAAGGGCGTTDVRGDAAAPSLRLRYLEIVAKDVAATCASLERARDLRFGAEDQDLGRARVARIPEGTLIGVRAPMAAHETPVVRPYFEVDDVERALKEAEAVGAIRAYGPTRQGDAGVFAIYFIGDAQIGLWAP